MTKSTLSPKELEQIVVKESDRMARAELDPADPTNYNIHKGMPLPADFVNPPVGEDGHHCVDRGGNYQPDWKQLIIYKNRDKQADPVSFPLGGNRYAVPLDVWVDAPPEILISLNDAEETEHRSNFSDDLVRLGTDVQSTKITRRRFFWAEKASA
jgi:hypothetical protein